MPYERIKWRKNKSGGKRGYRYLVESYREGGKVKQRTLEYLGPVGTTGQKSKVGTTTTSQVGTTKPKIKTIDEMNLAELRTLAKKYNVPSAGINKRTLRMRIKKQMKEERISESEAFQNIEQGSITTKSFQEEDFQVQIIDQDVEPLRKVKSQRMGPGMYDIQQETIIGEDENVTVMVSHTKPPKSKKREPSTLHLNEGSFHLKHTDPKNQIIMIREEGEGKRKRYDAVKVQKHNLKRDDWLINETNYQIGRGVNVRNDTNQTIKTIVKKYNPESNTSIKKVAEDKKKHRKYYVLEFKES